MTGSADLLEVLPTLLAGERRRSRSAIVDDMTTLHHGDSLDVLPTLPAGSVDAVVTDPPYELGFMGRTWDASGIAYNVDLWREVLRVLKPGGYLLAFGGTRTVHRLTCAIEDAGFEIRDGIDWIYGSGFPKSLNVGDGRGTALKPAREPIVMARKPFAGTVAANVQAYGTGALNIDACRVGTTRDVPASLSGNKNPSGDYGPRKAGTERDLDANMGRWPANVILSHASDCTDQCVPGCPVAELDRQSEGTRAAKPSRSGSAGVGESVFRGMTRPEPVDHGGSGASRFFPVFRYQAKAPTRERPKVDGVAHPTVKPLELMRWLVQLVTPPGGTVLDPFAGSGTTLEACALDGFHGIGIERDESYLPLINTRMARIPKQREAEAA